jgi:ribulose-5-phosphate 4-epimerase/fuculose-1-phosphate aldolase
MAISNSERQARIDLAAAFRLAVRFDLHEGVCNHFSLAVPGESGRFLLNPYGLHWSEITAGNLLTLDIDGRVLEGRGEAETSAFQIHSRIHALHSNAACVLHSHMPYTTALTTLHRGRLEPVEQNALRFYGAIAYDDTYNGVVLDGGEGDRLAGCLGDKRVLFLASHGVIVVGPTVGQAFDDLYYLERAARVQVLALSTGRPLNRLSDSVQRLTGEQLAAERAALAEPHFAALKRLLDRDEPDYAG